MPMGMQCRALFHDLTKQHVPGCSPAEARETTARAGLRPPYLGKPLHADGRDGSHALRVILDDQGLEELADSQIGLPLVLQQYVDHGGCLFKVRGTHILLCDIAHLHGGQKRG